LTALLGGVPEEFVIDLWKKILDNDSVDQREKTYAEIYANNLMLLLHNLPAPENATPTVLEFWQKMQLMVAAKLSIYRQSVTPSGSGAAEPIGASTTNSSELPTPRKMLQLFQNIC
jgi:hypothetical protein